MYKQKLVNEISKLSYKGDELTQLKLIVGLLIDTNLNLNRIKKRN